MREQRCCASRNASLAAVRSIASIAVATHSPYRSRDSGTRRVRCVNSGVVPGGTRRRNADCTVDRCSRRCDCLSSPAPRALPLSPAADRQTDRRVHYSTPLCYLLQLRARFRCHLPQTDRQTDRRVHYSTPLLLLCELCHLSNFGPKSTCYMDFIQGVFVWGFPPGEESHPQIYDPAPK